MKTIAITIDEDTLEHVDNVLAAQHASWRSRSHLIRNAVREFVRRAEQEAEEEKERKIFRRARARLERQAVALVKDQAKP